MGGEAWQVDLYHRDICSACAEFRECEIEFNDYREECPECYGACQECKDQYSLYQSCPECEIRDSCREELNFKIISCPLQQSGFSAASKLVYVRKMVE